MSGKNMLLTAYQYSFYLVTEALQGFTQKQSLIKPPGGDNPAIWVLGHILASRSNIEAMLDLEPTWDYARCKPYLPDSEPLHPDSQGEDLRTLAADFGSSQEKLVRKLSELSDQQLYQIAGDNSLGGDLAGYAIHEAFHAGELAMLGNWLE